MDTAYEATSGSPAASIASWSAADSSSTRRKSAPGPPPRGAAGGGGPGGGGGRAPPPGPARAGGRGPRLGERLGQDEAVAGRQALPLEREQAVALQVAERAVVAQHVEAIAGPLEGASRAVAAVAPLAHVGREDP